MQLKEMFGTGTACVVCPVDRILFLKEVHVHVYALDQAVLLTMNISAKGLTVSYGHMHAKVAMVTDGDRMEMIHQ